MEHAPQMPHSALAEQSVIGGLLLDNASWVKIAPLLVESDFYIKKHQYLFRAIKYLYSKGEAVDVVTVAEFVELKGHKDEIDLTYLAHLARDTPSAANIVSYARIVRDRSLLRQLYSIASGISQSALKPDGADAAQLLKDAEDALFKLNQDQLKGRQGFVRLGDALRKELNVIDEGFANPPETGVLGISTGFQELDSVTSGCQAGDFIVIAARPSMGKSSLAMNMGEAAAKLGKAVAVFSMEMSVQQLAQRMLSGSSKLPLRVIREPWTIKDYEWSQLTHGFQKIHGLPMFIEESPAQTASMIRAQCMRLNAQIRDEIPDGIGMVIIDYLQLMDVEGKVNQHNRNEQISDATRMLKTLAKEFNAPVIVLSQLSRDVEKRTNHRPILSDLRDSGAIEQDADLVLFVYRDEKYNADSADKGIAEVIIGKHRNGELGTVRLAFDGCLTRFRSLQ